MNSSRPSWPLRKDILGWDVVNWSMALDFWSASGLLPSTGGTCLELGGGANGGLSLWLAGLEHAVCFSCHQQVAPEAVAAHRRWRCDGRITYRSGVDATRLEVGESYDVVACKSILGGLRRDRGEEGVRAAIREAKRVLRPGGCYLFAENLVSTRVHALLRRRLGGIFGGGRGWHYFAPEELLRLVREEFGPPLHVTGGFLGCFGRPEAARVVLGLLDRWIGTRVVPPGWHYIMAGIVRKPGPAR